MNHTERNIENEKFILENNIKIIKSQEENEKIRYFSENRFYREKEFKNNIYSNDLNAENVKKFQVENKNFKNKYNLNKDDKNNKKDNYCISNKNENKDYKNFQGIKFFILIFKKI